MTLLTFSCWVVSPKRQEVPRAGAVSLALLQAFKLSGHQLRRPLGRLGGSWAASLTGLTQALSFALCSQAERVQLRARAHAQTGRRPEPSPAANGAHVSDRAQPVGVAPCQSRHLTDLCPQADPVLPGPARPHCPPESGDKDRGAAQSQVGSSSGPWVGRGRDRVGAPRPCPFLHLEPCGIITSADPAHLS